MAALACIRNCNKPSQTLIFYTTEEYQCGYDTAEEKDLNEKFGYGEHDRDGAPRNLNPGENSRAPTSGTPKEEDPTGLIKHPSTMCPLYFQNILIVYGIQASNNRIIQVSPGVKPLQQKITTSRSGLAGCGDGKNLGWLYYVSSAEVPAIKQYELVYGANVVMQGPPTPDADTFLSAWFKDTDSSRGVVYQNKDNTNLKYWEIKKDGGQNNSEIDNTTQAAKSTPLCTVVVDDKVYLYFINSSKSLIRLERTGSNVWTNQISDSQNEWNANPISALCSQNKKYIVLRQQYTEGDGWLEYPDKRGM